jgi:phage gp37-like protein
VYTIEQIQDSIVTALQGKTELAALCRAIEPYHGVVDDIIEEAGKGKGLLVAQVPAVYVLYGGSRFPEMLTTSSYDDNQTYTIVTIAKDLRGRSAARAGIYTLIELEKTVLIHNALGLQIQPLFPVSIMPILLTKVVSIYGFDVGTFFDIQK